MSIRDLVKKYEDKGGKIGWIKLVNDKDAVLVRFLHTGVDDLEVYEVHKTEIDGFTKAIKCKGDNCPMCRAGNNPQLRTWLAMQNLDKAGHPVELWERGRNDIASIIGLIDENGNLNERDYKIVRNGKAGSTKTTYQYFYKDKDIKELPARPQILGRYVLDLSEEDMIKAMNGTLTLNNNNNSNTNTNNNSGNQSTPEGDEVF